MATITKTSTSTYQVLSETSCLFQKIGSGDCYIQYADSLPTASNFETAHHVSNSSIMNLPAPTSGLIYVASPNDVKVLVTEI